MLLARRGGRRTAHIARLQRGRRPTCCSPLRTGSTARQAYISPISPCISPISRLYLPISRLYLAYISGLALLLDRHGYTCSHHGYTGMAQLLDRHSKCSCSLAAAIAHYGYAHHGATAPPWLFYCSTGWWMIRAGWLALRPRYAYISHISPIYLPISRLYIRLRYAVCSVLHLVELRSQVRVRVRGGGRGRGRGS